MKNITVEYARIIRDTIDDLPPQDQEIGLFSEYHSLGAQTKGKVSAMAVSELLEQFGVKVGPANSKDADRTCNRHQTEFKSSTRWKTGMFRAQQIRRQQDWDRLIICAYEKNNAYLFCIPKKDLHRFEEADMLYGQHCGPYSVETEWLTFKPTDDLMLEYGGPLSNNTMEKIKKFLQ